MKKFFMKYHRHLTFEIQRPKSHILDFISQEKDRKKNLFDFLIGTSINYKDIKFTGDDSMEVIVHPYTLSPYRGTGKIRIAFTKGQNVGETKLQAEIIPYNSIHKIAWFIILSVLVLFTISGLLISIDKNVVFMLTFSWIFFPVILYLLPIWSRSQLEESLSDLVNELKRKSIR